MFNSEEYTEQKGNSKQKMLSIGTQVCRIIDMTWKPAPWNRQGQDQLLLQFTLEGEPLGEGFEGFSVDKEKPEMGNYEGQIGYVNSSAFPFSTFSYQGEVIDRDPQIFNYVNSMAVQLGIFDEIQKEKIKAETIEEYLTKVKPFFINPELWATFVIGGSERWVESKGKYYLNYNLYFLRKEGDKYSFSALVGEDGKMNVNLIKFDEENTKHVYRKPKPADIEQVNEFDPNTTTVMDSSPAAEPIEEATSISDLPF